jgi:hypothetical protein
MYDVKSVKCLEDYKLELVFENGERGIVDLSGYRNKGGVFSRFADQSYFRKVYVNQELGTICWPDGADIAPETLYTLVTGKPMPVHSVGA